jgi:hypothetical protein
MCRASHSDNRSIYIDNGSINVVSALHCTSVCVQQCVIYIWKLYLDVMVRTVSRVINPSPEGNSDDVKVTHLLSSVGVSMSGDQELWG